MGGNAASGAQTLHEAVTIAADNPELLEQLPLLPWIALGPIFLRESEAGRDRLEAALRSARERGAIGTLPFVLALIARDQATTDRWRQADATYREAIALARETDQRTWLAFGLAGIAWLQARQGREAECRMHRAGGARAGAKRSAPACPRCGRSRRSENWSSDSAGLKRRSSSSSASGGWPTRAPSPTSTCGRRPRWSRRMRAWTGTMRRAR